MGTQISHHQSQVGHEADESRAKRAEGGGMGWFQTTLTDYFRLFLQLVSEN